MFPLPDVQPLCEGAWVTTTPGRGGQGEENKEEGTMVVWSVYRFVADFLLTNSTYVKIVKSSILHEFEKAIWEIFLYV